LDIYAIRHAAQTAGMWSRTSRCALAVLATACSTTSSSSNSSTIPARRSVRAPTTGTMHDFDYFVGGWTTTQHRLVARGVGSHEWEEFPATLCMTPYLDGLANVGELVMPTKGSAGLTLRTFDAAKRQWSIYWVGSKTGTLGTPVIGAFDGPRGEFYGEDDDGGRPVQVRYAWTKIDRDHANWEQAFSYDEGVSWEVNWTADFVRADTATTCDAGRPRSQGT
jgi:hypothetical protein